MKPIEPGCLALVVKGSATGATVQCVSFVGTHTDRHGTYHNNDLWKIDRGLPWHINGEKVYKPFYPESYLLRIDGHEEPTTTEKAVEA